MGFEVIAYPFLFLAIFFESFVLVTLLSKPARLARRRAPITTFPSVAVIVPCYNEAKTLADTCASLLALDYPPEKLSIILVDDGSTDETPRVMECYARHPQVSVIHKENGGKHTALNAGITATRAELVGCLDADSFVEPDALREIVASFTGPRVAATTAAMAVYRPRNMLEYMQHAEYAFGITLRHAIASVNGLYVTPGPFSFYRRNVIEEVGGFREGHKTEDMEMALRLQKAGYAIENAPYARVYTKTPRTLSALLTQRTRWTTGFLRNMINEYRGLVGNRAYGVLGLLVLPLGLVAIASGILLFASMLLLLTTRTVTAITLRFGVPFSYAYIPHGLSFDWFFLPSSAYLVLGLATLTTSLTLILVGKYLARVPGRMGLGMVSYALLYGLIVPLWLIRATADVALGKRRSWR